MASRPSELDFWTRLQSEPGQRDMASRPSKPDFWIVFQPYYGQHDTASRPSMCDCWNSPQSEPGQCDMASDQSLDNVTWPAGLQCVTFRTFFNQSLDNVTWPAGLQCVTFGEFFDQRLDNLTWSAGLQSLTFGANFNQSLNNVTWPANLQSLTFGQNFNQSLDNVTWPAGLQSLTFGRRFHQSLDNVTWPAGLRNLTFDCFSFEKLNVVWPEGLQSLSFLDIQLPEKRQPAVENSAVSDSRVDSKVVPRTGWPRALRKLVFDDLVLVCWNKNRMLKVRCWIFSGSNWWISVGQIFSNNGPRPDQQLEIYLQNHRIFDKYTRISAEKLLSSFSDLCVVGFFGSGRQRSFLQSKKGKIFGHWFGMVW